MEEHTNETTHHRPDDREEKTLLNAMFIFARGINRSLGDFGPGHICTTKIHAMFKFELLAVGVAQLKGDCGRSAVRERVCSFLPTGVQLQMQR